MYTQAFLHVSASIRHLQGEGDTKKFIHTLNVLIPICYLLPEKGRRPLKRVGEFTCTNNL